jgi:penicillin-binding protein-related factor A (putative recombinase)
MKITNTGNGLTFEKQIKKTIDYLDAEYIRIILSIDEINSVEDKKPRLRIVRERDIIKL